MAIIKLQTVARVEPVVGPGLRALAVSANPTANQVAVIGIAAAPREIEIVEAVTDVAAERIVGVDAFDPEIELWNFRNVRKKTAPRARRNDRSNRWARTGHL